MTRFSVPTRKGDAKAHNERASQFLLDVDQPDPAGDLESRDHQKRAVFTLKNSDSADAKKHGQLPPK